MKVQWLEGTKGEERRLLKEYVLGSKKLLDILSKMLYNMYKDADEVSLKDYDSPSWSERQAHLNGKKEVIRDLIALCNLQRDFD